jgi:FtsK/SpoIIIE family
MNALALSYWFALGFFYKAVRTFTSWAEVAEGCTLTKTRKRALRKGTYVSRPRLGFPRPHAYGLRLWVRLTSGQTPVTIAEATPRLQHSWRAHGVRVEATKPGKVLLSVTMRDPLARVNIPAAADEFLRPVLGRLETGGLWRIDFKTVPHWLITGATQSGKSTFINALIAKLAKQKVALVGFDLKGGMEFTPYKARLSKLATNREQVVEVLAELIDVLEARMSLCAANGASNIWQLPEHRRPVPTVVLVDEVAELFLTAETNDKEVTTTAVQLLRIAQLGRALGIYLIVAGQRVGSDLGKGVTALRAQLSGRICFRVNDGETAKMTLGDLSAEAVDAAQQILPTKPGVAITGTDSGLWQHARSIAVSTEQAQAAARENTHLATPWEELVSPGASTLV